MERHPRTQCDLIALALSTCSKKNSKLTSFAAVIAEVAIASFRCSSPKPSNVLTGNEVASMIKFRCERRKETNFLKYLMSRTDLSGLAHPATCLLQPRLLHCPSTATVNNKSSSNPQS
ncbi:unnamed protein product [Cercospora beticola]|nr:unnamed protein product [Cercospora beticola]